MATQFTWGMASLNSDVVSNIIPILLSIVIWIRNKVSFNDKKLLLVLCVTIIWIVLSTLKYEAFKLSNLFIIENILISYLMISVYKDKFWDFYVDIVYKLSIVGLIGWIFVLFIPDFVRQLMFMPISINTIEGNNFLFSMTNQINKEYAIRNSGFSWEPGRFACILVVALFISIIRNRRNIINKKNVVLIVSLISTFSTTGYMAFLSVCVPLYLYNLPNRKISVFLLPLLFVGSIYIYSLEFMGEKITSLSAVSVENLENVSKYNTAETSSYITLQRFDGMLWDYINFINDPLLGYGHSEISNSFNAKNLSDHVIAAGGIVGIFAKYGVFAALLVYIILYKTSSMLSKRYNYKGIFLFFLLFVLISISYSFWTVPIFMPMWMSGLFIKNTRITNNYSKKYILKEN